MENTGKKLPRSFGWDDIERLKPKNPDYARIMNGPIERPKQSVGSPNRPAYPSSASREVPKALPPPGDPFTRFFGGR